MVASNELDGKLYSAPWYAANRVVIYDKAAFKKAGVTRRRPAPSGSRA